MGLSTSSRALQLIDFCLDLRPVIVAILMLTFAYLCDLVVLPKMNVLWHIVHQNLSIAKKVAMTAFVLLVLLVVLPECQWIPWHTAATRARIRHDRTQNAHLNRVAAAAKLSPSSTASPPSPAPASLPTAISSPIVRATVTPVPSAATPPSAAGSPQTERPTSTTSGPEMVTDASEPNSRPGDTDE